MDELDARILRELFKGRVLLWGGGDARLSTREMAKRVGVDHTTVWSRLKAWREDGFLLGNEIVPNPGLFGVGIAGGDVSVKDPRSKPALLESLRLIDGILAAVDQVGPYTILLYAQPSEQALDRCRQLVGKLPDVDEVSQCIPFSPPVSGIEPTRTDWRIVQALRQRPDAPVGELAEAAGVSQRTFTRRYAQLLEASAIWSLPLFDFSRYQGALLARFVVELASPDDTAQLGNDARKGLEGTFWVDGLANWSPEIAKHEPWADIYCHVDAAAEVEEVHRWILDRPYVKSAEVYYPKAWLIVGQWFDERIAQKLQA